MNDPEDIFEYDPNWPPKDVTRPWSLFTKKEDKLILQYLLKTHQRTSLGGNEVWKKLATSRKFNPGQRTFHSLRERYCKYLRQRLSQYLTAEQEEFLLGRTSNSRTNRGKISKKDALEEWERTKHGLTGNSSESDEDNSTVQIVTDERSEDRSRILLDKSAGKPDLAKVLRERSDLLSKVGLTNAKVITSTVCQPAAATTGPLVLEDAENHLSDTERNYPVKAETRPADEGFEEKRATELRMLTYTIAPVMALENFAETQCDESAEFEEKTVQTKQEPGDAIRVTLRNGTEYIFEFTTPGTVDSLTEGDSGDLIDVLNYVQNQLRNVLIDHSAAVRVGDSRKCSNANCVGFETYLDCWVDLGEAWSRAERYSGQECQAFFKRVFAARVKDLLSVPVCSRSSPGPSIEQLDPDRIYGSLEDSAATDEVVTLRRLIETSYALRDALRIAV